MNRKNIFLALLCQFLFLSLIPIGSGQMKDTVLYYRSGEKQAEGKMSNGAKQGRWIFYYKSGLKSKSVVFQQGLVGGPGYVVTGKEYTWFPTGVLKEEFNWTKGKIDGVQKSYYASGALKRELVCVKGIYYSEIKEYYYSDNEEYALKSVFLFHWDNTPGENNIAAEIPSNLFSTYEDNQRLYPALKKCSWKNYYLSGALQAEGVYEKGKHLL